MTEKMLVVDQGNTRIKIALFEDDRIIDLRAFNQLSDEQLLLLLEEYEIPNSKYTPVKHAILSSVAANPSNLIDTLRSRINLTVLDNNTPLPISVFYDTPETLGNDRIALVTGASYIHPENSLLVIDAGTCITYDFINSKREYFGGGISPGLNMRFKALNTFTGKLPLVEPIGTFDLIGSTTETSILSGVFNGIISELDGIIARYQEIYADLTIIMTGGDTNYFDKELKNNIFAIPNLVLIGLKDILRYNVHK